MTEVLLPSSTGALRPLITFWMPEAHGRPCSEQWPAVPSSGHQGPCHLHGSPGPRVKGRSTHIRTCLGQAPKDQNQKTALDPDLV